MTIRSYTEQKKNKKKHYPPAPVHTLPETQSNYQQERLQTLPLTALVMLSHCSPVAPPSTSPPNQELSNSSASEVSHSKVPPEKAVLVKGFHAIRVGVGGRGDTEGWEGGADEGGRNPLSIKTAKIILHQIYVVSL